MTVRVRSDQPDLTDTSEEGWEAVRKFTKELEEILIKAGAVRIS